MGMCNKRLVRLVQRGGRISRHWPLIRCATKKAVAGDTQRIGTMNVFGPRIAFEIDRNNDLHSAENQKQAAV